MVSLPTGIPWPVLLLPWMAPAQSPDNQALRLVVETTDDLTSYRLDAEFSFRVSRPDVDIVLHFPGADSPADFESIELDGRAVNRSELRVEVDERHHSGDPVFLMRAPASEGNTLHRLRVRGPAAAVPSSGFTRWGSWHPWLGGRDVPAPIELEVRTHPAYTVLASGRHVEDRVADGRRISRWRSGRPQGWMFLAIGEYQVETIGEETPAFDVARPRSLRAFDSALIGAEPHRILRFFSRTFGAHDLDRFRLLVFPSESRHNISVDGLIAVSTASYDQAGEGSSYLRAVLAHELAHYWWGDLVRAEGPGRAWLSEGFAEYSRYLYEEEVQSDFLPWSYRNLIVLSRYSDGSTPPPLAGEPLPDADEVYYQKGPFVLAMLADEVGREALLRAMRRLVEAGRRSPVALHDFQHAVEQEAGRHLAWFFDQWLLRPTAPLLGLEEVRVERGGAGYVVSGFLRQQPPAYRLSVVLEVDAEDGTTRRTLEVNGERQPFSFQLEGSPRRLVVDPDHCVFRWHPTEQMPVGFTDAWRKLETGSAVHVVLGADVPAAEGARLLDFLRQRFPGIAQMHGAAGLATGILVGQPARELRLRQRPGIEPPPPGTVQAFVVRSADGDGVLVGIEGDWPDPWPEIVPQASLDFVRYRDGAMVAATAPSLPALAADLGSTP